MSNKMKVILAVAGGVMTIAGIGAAVALAVFANKGVTKQYPVLKNLNEIEGDAEKECDNAVEEQ